MGILNKLHSWLHAQSVIAQQKRALEFLAEENGILKHYFHGIENSLQKQQGCQCSDCKMERAKIEAMLQSLNYLKGAYRAKEG